MKEESWLEDLCERIGGDYISEIQERCEVTLNGRDEFEDVLNEVTTELDLHYGEKYSFSYQVVDRSVSLNVKSKSRVEESSIRMSAQSPSKFTITKLGDEVVSLEFLELDNGNEWTVEFYPKAGGILGRYRNYQTDEALIVKDLDSLFSKYGRR